MRQKLDSCERIAACTRKAWTRKKTNSKDKESKQTLSCKDRWSKRGSMMTRGMSSCSEMM